MRGPVCAAHGGVENAGQIQRTFDDQQNTAHHHDADSRTKRVQHRYAQGNGYDAEQQQQPPFLPLCAGKVNGGTDAAQAVNNDEDAETMGRKLATTCGFASVKMPSPP